MYNNKRSADKSAGAVGAGSSKNSAAASPSAQLGASTRARTDPKRTVGTANAVAAGLDLTRVGILSDRELDWIRSLAYGSTVELTQDAQRAAEMARRKELSDARRARWPDTTEARQAAFLRSRQEEKDDAERRKATLDELYAQQKEEERLSKVAAVEFQRLKDDPRSRNARSAVMLHEAIKAREEQVAFRESVKAAQSIEDEQERNAMLMEQWGHTAEELQKRLAARERNMAEKNANLETVLFQIQERRQQRRDEKEEGVLAKIEAANEARENAEEEAERKQRQLEVGLYNESCAGPRLTKSDKLKQRLEANAEDEANRIRQEKRLSALKQDAVDRQQKKQARFEEQKRVGLQRYAAEKAVDSPKRRTQDRFEGKPESFLSRMAGEDSVRTRASKENRLKEVEAEKAAAEMEAASGAQKAYTKAEATASGFITFEEEEAYLAEMRALPERARAEQEAEAASRMAEAKRVESIQRMQAAEKREQRRREVEQERENARRQRDHQSQEDARFQAFIQSQIPEDMSDHLRAKALQF